MNPSLSLSGSTDLICLQFYSFRDFLDFIELSSVAFTVSAFFNSLYTFSVLQLLQHLTRIDSNLTFALHPAATGFSTFPLVFVLSNCFNL